MLHNTVKPHSNSRRFWLVRQSAQQTVSEMGGTFNEEKWSKEARSEVRGRERVFFFFFFKQNYRERERNASTKRIFTGLFVQEVVSYNKDYTLLPGEMWFCTKVIFIPKISDITNRPESNLNALKSSGNSIFLSSLFGKKIFLLLRKCFHFFKRTYWTEHICSKQLLSLKRLGGCFPWQQPTDICEMVLFRDRLSTSAVLRALSSLFPPHHLAFIMFHWKFKKSVLLSEDSLCC